MSMRSSGGTSVETMMLRAAIVVIALAVAAPAFAGEAALNGEGIRAALTGNTVDGVSGEPGTPYRQYFDAGGATLYVEEGRRPSQGRWWATADAYCSSWPPSGAASCYGVRRDGDTIIWVVPGSGARYPSTLLPGRQIE